jgi:Core-2/I-Branching enzyme
MKIVYLIAAHHAPLHLGRLIAALSSESSTFVVHVDAKSDLGDFLHVESDNVALTRDRVSVWWGDFSQVEATLTLIRAGLDVTDPGDRLVFLSGADYPLRSAAYIERFFEQHPALEFMNLVAVPNEAAGKPLSRFTTYQPSPGRTAPSRAVRRVALGAGRRVHRRNYERALRGLAPYGGSTWWALSHEACELVVDFVGREPQIVDFFRHVICPDESFFQTIIGNSVFRERVRRNLTFVDWSAGGQNPSRLTESHLHRFARSGAHSVNDVYGSGELLFARKFGDADAGLVAELDRWIAADETTSSS